MRPVQLNTVYKCRHLESIEVANVSQFFWDVTMQVFVQNGTVSKNGKSLKIVHDAHVSNSHFRNAVQSTELENHKCLECIAAYLA